MVGAGAVSINGTRSRDEASSSETNDDPSKGSHVCISASIGDEENIRQVRSLVAEVKDVLAVPV